MARRGQRGRGVEDALEGEFAHLRAVYDDVDRATPVRDCRLRTTCCRFAVTGAEPQVTELEVAYLLSRWRATGRRLPSVEPGGDCPMLDPDDGRCLAYDGRPLGCRTHFCDAAGGKVSRASLSAALAEIDALDDARGGRGSRPLTAALASVHGGGGSRKSRRRSRSG